jgi:hypothetical protein
MSPEGESWVIFWRRTQDGEDRPDEGGRVSEHSPSTGEGVVDLPSTVEWQQLARHFEEIRGAHLRSLFEDDPDRGTEMTAAAGDLYLDYSKHRVTGETIDLLMAIARRAGVEEHRDAMFAGRRINTTEDRAVLHVALRMPRDARLEVGGRDVVAGVHKVLDRMGEVASAIRSGEWTGHTGKRITAVVNIGIGGSDLGPAMAYEALRDYATPDIECRFVSNIDPVDLVRQDPRPRSCPDTLRGQLQDVHHVRDADQRLCGASVAARRAGERGGRRGPPLRRRIHQRVGGAVVRHRPGQHVRVLGLGGRSVLLRLGHRLLPDGGHRPRSLRRDAGRVPHHRPALPTAPARGQPAGHPGHAQRLVQQLLRGADPRRPALQPASGPLPGLPPAADNGVQRQVGAPGRQSGGGARPGRSSGASRAPTGSTPSTSSSTRGRSSSRATSSGSPNSTHETGSSRTC